ncbi:hypothetical protein IV203_022407 [Nitzschia inconspicua]|uniref:Uncharacterized protein n=1 Tax=Nitzschia inconspicua TaxID=303405 RepID=A0A9K3PGS8_9STRA|nr:hypothetical protein IV203_022407 [Nitzschia inconspicua]
MSRTGKSSNGCLRMPYKDKILISAQACSMAGMLVSFYIYYTLILGLPGAVILQVACCCRMKKAGLTTAAVFLAISGLVAVVYGGVFAVLGIGVASAFGFIGGGLYIAASICTFIFVYTDRYGKCRRLSCENEESDIEKGPQKSSIKNDKKRQPTEKDESDGSVVEGVLDDGTSVHKTIYHLPDGSIRIEVETILPDGSKQVKTTIERAAG